MDWNLAIEINRAALKRVLALLVGMAGGAGGLPSPLWGASARSDGVLDVASSPARATRPSHNGEAGPRPTLPRHLRLAILRLLRPAEAATRRLVIAAAHGLVVPPVRPRKPQPPKPASIFLRRGSGGTGMVLPPGFRFPPTVVPPPLTPPRKGEGDSGAAPQASYIRNSAETVGSASPSPVWGKVRGGSAQGSARRLGFRLLDPLSCHRPRRPAARSVPRISFPGASRPFPVAPRLPLKPYDPIDATRLALRLQALARALDDLPRHARRFARWRNRAAAGAQGQETFVAAGAQNKHSRVAGAQNGEVRGKAVRVWPLRMGRLAGPRRGAHEVHAVLVDKHGLALWALAGRDTS